MVVTITMKNVRLRNGIYEFRMRVPKDCQESVGKSEITKSLNTSNASEADVLSTKLNSEWTTKFQAIRKNTATTTAIKVRTSDTAAGFQKGLDAHLADHLTEYIDKRTDAELRESVKRCKQGIAAIQSNSTVDMDLSEELGITLPLLKQKSPGMLRRMNKAAVSVLEQIIVEIEKEIGSEPSEIAKKIMVGVSKPQSVANPETDRNTASQNQNTMDVSEVMNLMFMAKNTDAKFKNRIEVEIGCLMEWCGGKNDITQYTKADLVDYVHNCLPYIPLRMNQKKPYKAKTLRECVDLVKSDPKKYEPISYKTCENRYIGAKSVFTFAKDQLGLITVNPVSGIKIPVVRTVATDDRAFSEDELSSVWTKVVSEAHDEIGKYPERYWSVVLSLYHGCRQNEVCSLKVKDVFLDSDDVYVFRIQEELGIKGKTTKTAGSNRIVPIHPYVLNDLDFKGYAESRRAEAKEDDMLFPNVTYAEGANFGRKVSRWFSAEKKDLFSSEVHHKNFHSLRHTFIQQAQNQAKMPDRYNQEITGHSVSGVSSVHMGYSGRLKPKDVLEELSKVKYGWE